MSSASARGASRFLRALEVMRQLDAEMPAQTISTFLAVVEEPGIPIPKLAEKLGLSQSSSSRNVAALSKWQKFNVPGHDLVEAEPNPEDRRFKIVKLTRKGERLAEKLNEVLG